MLLLLPLVDCYCIIILLRKIDRRSLPLPKRLRTRPLLWLLLLLLLFYSLYYTFSGGRSISWGDIEYGRVLMPLNMVDFVTPGSMRLKVDEVSVPSPIISVKTKKITAKRTQLSSEELFRSNSRRLTRIKGSLIAFVNTYSFHIVLLSEVKW